jgi:mRNA interferase YafQ
MQYVTSKQFDKSFSKLAKGIKEKVITQLSLFVENPMDSRLRNHALSGKWSAYRSIQITGDIRAIYSVVNETVVLFIDIGSHSKLYS